jgi:hypothetical protein
MKIGPFNITRESWLWWGGLIGAIVVGLAALDTSTAVDTFGIPASWLPRLRLAALIVGIGSAWAKTSPFPSKKDNGGRVDPSKLAPVVLLALALGASGCAAKLTPLKQAQITKSSLDAAFDLEASLCWGVASVHLGPADRTKCTAPTARAIGLTDARHQEINRGFTRAYMLHYDATRLLRAGEKADLVELAKAISSLVSQILQLQQTPAVKELAETVQKGAIK